MTNQIVVVAGDNETLQALSEHLDAHIKVKYIESANEVLWEVRSDPPAVIIADTDLPEMSGLEMAEILPNFDVPTRIILCSRGENPAVAREAEACGVYRFFHGSFSPEDIHAAIQEALREHPVPASEPEPEPEHAPEPEPEHAPEAAPAPEPPLVPEPVPAPPVSATVERPPSRNRLASRAGGVASRSRAAASEHRPARRPSVEPEPESHHHHHRRRTDTLVLTAENLHPIRSIMSQLSQELGPQCVLLTDRAGMVLVEVGTTDRLPVMILLPLLSTSFASSGEVARQLGEEDATTLYIHEGVNYDLYCFDIAQNFLLVLVFNKKVASSKIGAVWVNTKRAIRELQEALLT